MEKRGREENNERKTERERKNLYERQKTSYREKRRKKEKKNQIKLTAYAKAQRAYRRFPESNLIAGNGHN